MESGPWPAPPFADEVHSVVKVSKRGPCPRSAPTCPATSDQRSGPLIMPTATQPCLVEAPAGAVQTATSPEASVPTWLRGQHGSGLPAGAQLVQPVTAGVGQQPETLTMSIHHSVCSSSIEKHLSVDNCPEQHGWASRGLKCYGTDQTPRAVLGVRVCSQFTLTWEFVSPEPVSLSVK